MKNGLGLFVFLTSGLILLSGCFDSGEFSIQISSDASYEGTITVRSFDGELLYNEDISGSGDATYIVEVYEHAFYTFSITTTGDCIGTNTSVNFFHSSIPNPLPLHSQLSGCGQTTTPFTNL
jgi:hypothetical protein